MKNTIDKDIEKVNKLWYLLDDVYSTGLVENEERNEYQQSIENVLSELETYKKIAEKLAEHISKRCYYVDDYSNSCDVIEDSCFEDKDCKQCIIDWARKEVEKDENSSSL